MAVFGQPLFYSDEFSYCSSPAKERESEYITIVYCIVAVVVVLMAVAATSRVTAASAPTGPERNAAPGNCPATFQELRAALTSGASDYQESDCSTLGVQLVVLTKLDNPSGHWIGPETVSAALGQMAAVSLLDNPNSQWIGPETVSAAQAQLQLYSAPTIGGSGELTRGASGRGPYASPQAAPVSMRRQYSDAPGR
jgi:hypothetical protein